MTKNEFMETVKDATLAILREKDETIDAIISNVTKTNGVAYSGLSFRGENNIQPVVYLDSFFERYEKGEIDVANIAKTVADIYMSNKWNNDFDMACITNFEKVKDNIMPFLYNTEANAESLKTMPSRKVEDLSLFYKLKIPFSSQDGNGYVTIHNNLMELWNVTEKDLYELAWENLKASNKPVFKGMMEVLMDIMGGEGIPQGDIPEADVPMFILTTEDKYHGSVYMADNKVLSDIAKELDDNLLILPSSRRELIILKEATASDVDWLKGMVMEVNSTQVAPEDFLSDSVYFFDRQTEKLSIVA